MNADTARAEARLFDEAIVCDEVRPCAFTPGALPPHVADRLCLEAETLLRALAVVEDSGSDGPEKHSHDTALQRIEAKLDLLTALLASLAAHRADPPRPLRWSSRGGTTLAEERVPPGSTGLFRIQPADWLPQVLQLPATVLATEEAGESTRLWLEFGPLPPALATALERHLFRVHRCAIAERRRQR